MSKLDTNLATYRAMAETMGHLRELVRDALREAYGEEWEARGLAAPTRGYLAQRREREAAIQWRLQSDVDLLDYAGFADIGEIIQAEPRLAELFSAVSRDLDLLRSRLIELDSIQSRVAYVRPLSEGELELVVNFGERLRKIDPSQRPVGVTTEPGQRRPDAPNRVAVATASRAAAGSATTPLTTEAGGDVRRGPSPAPGGRNSAETKVETAVENTKVTSNELAAALASNQTMTVLTALYHEITRLAELLWVDSRTAATPAWDAVRESKWYKANFSPLGLKVVSDFYDLQLSVVARIAAGAGSDEIRQTLQEHRFGELLLALRELFKRHLVSNGPSLAGKSPGQSS